MRPIAAWSTSQAKKHDIFLEGKHTELVSKSADLNEQTTIVRNQDIRKGLKE